MGRIKKFWKNGGKVATILTLILTSLMYLIALSYQIGRASVRIETVEKKVDKLERIEQDIAYLKASTERIMEILQGKYEKRNNW